MLQLLLLPLTTCKGNSTMSQGKLLWLHSLRGLQVLLLYSPYNELGINVTSLWPRYSPYSDRWFSEVR